MKNELRLAAHDEVHLRTEIMVPKQSIGRIIGKGGQNVSSFQNIHLKWKRDSIMKHAVKNLLQRYSFLFFFF